MDEKILAALNQSKLTSLVWEALRERAGYDLEQQIADYVGQRRPPEETELQCVVVVLRSLLDGHEDHVRAMVVAPIELLERQRDAAKAVLKALQKELGGRTERMNPNDEMTIREIRRIVRRTIERCVGAALPSLVASLVDQHVMFEGAPDATGKNSRALRVNTALIVEEIWKAGGF